MENKIFCNLKKKKRKKLNSIFFLRDCYKREGRSIGPPVSLLTY